MRTYIQEHVRQPSGELRLQQDGPFAAGLVSVVCAGVTISGRAQFQVGNGSRRVFGSGRYGAGQSLVGNSSGFLTESRNYQLGGQFTLFVMMASCTRRDTDNTPAGFGASAGNQTFLFQSDTATSAIRFVLRQTNGGDVTTRVIDSPIGPDSTTPFSICGVVTGSSSIDAYYNGVLANGTLAAGSSGNNASFDRLSLGAVRRNTDLLGGAGQDAILVAGWNRALTAAEIFGLNKNPWQIFEPQRIWVPVATNGADVLITGAPGNAVAAGAQSRVDQAIQVTGTTGNAVANGVSARVNQARQITGTAGNATAAGVAARVDQARRITGTAGNAAAAGQAASIYVGRLITATPGNAAAAGVNATIAVARVIQATPGNAVAQGRPATIGGAQIVSGNAGAATAAGVTAQVGQGRQVTGNAANATAEGLLASIYRGVTVQTTPANAAADGVDATVLQAITISATAGNAVAAGRTARIIEGDTPIYAAIPASRKARGRFGERPAQLSTGRRR